MYRCTQRLNISVNRYNRDFSRAYIYHVHSYEFMGDNNGFSYGDGPIFLSFFSPPSMDGKKFGENDSSNDLIPRLLIRSRGRLLRLLHTREALRGIIDSKRLTVSRMFVYLMLNRCSRIVRLIA